MGASSIGYAEKGADTLNGKQQNPIPIALRDVSYTGAIRKIVDVLIFGETSDEELVAQAQGAIQHYAKYGDAQAFCIFFWWSREDIGKRKAAASVDFAPHGRWEDAHLAPRGDYSQRPSERGPAPWDGSPAALSQPTAASAALLRSRDLHEICVAVPDSAAFVAGANEDVNFAASR